jgi:hypothetical protein
VSRQDEFVYQPELKRYACYKLVRGCYINGGPRDEWVKMIVQPKSRLKTSAKLLSAVTPDLRIRMLNPDHESMIHYSMREFSGSNAADLRQFGIVMADCLSHAEASGAIEITAGMKLSSHYISLSLQEVKRIADLTLRLKVRTSLDRLVPRAVHREPKLSLSISYAPAERDEVIRKSCHEVSMAFVMNMLQSEALGADRCGFVYITVHRPSRWAVEIPPRFFSLLSELHCSFELDHF